MKKQIVVCDLCNLEIHRDDHEITFRPFLIEDVFDVCDNCLEIIYKAVVGNMLNDYALKELFSKEK